MSDFSSMTRSIRALQPYVVELWYKFTNFVRIDNYTSENETDETCLQSSKVALYLSTSFELLHMKLTHAIRNLFYAKLTLSDKSIAFTFLVNAPDEI